MFREQATRPAGKEFRGITFRGRGDTGRWRAQAGLRVTPGTVAKIRHHFLREDQLPIPEARGIKQDMMWIMKGLPADFWSRTLASAIYSHLQWPVVALKELSRPSAATATWLVSSADKPPRETWWIDTGARGPSLVTISQKVEGPKGGWKGRGKTNEGAGRGKGNGTSGGGERRTNEREETNRGVKRRQGEDEVQRIDISSEAG